MGVVESTKMNFDNGTSNSDYDTFDNTEVPIPRPVRFWLLLVFNSSALACTLFVLFHLLSQHRLRQSPNNYVIIGLLSIALMSNLIDIPSYLTFLRLGYVWPASTIFCSFWWLVSIGLFDTIAILMAFGAIEKHILIFHQNWVSTWRKRCLVHHLPFLLVTSYSLTFYIVVLLFPSCENVFDYEQAWCGSPCYYDDTVLAAYDSVVNAMLPTLLIAIFSIALVVRFIRQRRRVQRTLQWRKHRRMVVQLVLTSSLHLLFDLPVLILITAHLCGLPRDVGAEAQLYAYFLTYFIPLLLPYVCLAGLPEIHKKISFDPRQWWTVRLRRTRAVAPTIT